MAKNERPDYRSMANALTPSYVAAQAKVLELTKDIQSLQGQRDVALVEPLSIYNNRSIFEVLQRGVESRDNIWEVSANSPLIGGINEKALDVLSNAVVDPLQLGKSLGDNMSIVTLPVPGDQLNTRVITADDTVDNFLPTAVLRVAAMSTSVVIFHQGLQSNIGTKAVPAIVLSIKDGGDGRYTISGYRTEYAFNPESEDATSLVRIRDLKPPKFLQLYSPSTETDLVKLGFLSPAEYQTALSLVASR